MYEPFRFLTTPSSSWTKPQPAQVVTPRPKGNTGMCAYQTQQNTAGLWTQLKKRPRYRPQEARLNAASDLRLDTLEYKWALLLLDIFHISYKLHAPAELLLG